MPGIKEAQARWEEIHARGRTRGIIALVVVVAVLLAIAFVAGSNASTVVLVVVGVAIVALVAVAVIGRRVTGLSITPEWKPEPVADDLDDYDDDFDDEGIDAPDDADDPVAAEADQDDFDDEGAEPVRRLDAQILGADLSKLGQVVSPKLAKSYAVGTLVLEDSAVVWKPGAVSRAAGIDELSTAPEQVSTVEAAPLWGSWALVRVATTEGDEWCMRVPGSVDLAPAFAELGLTLHRV